MHRLSKKREILAKYIGCLHKHDEQPWAQRVAMALSPEGGGIHCPRHAPHTVPPLVGLNRGRNAA